MNGKSKRYTALALSLTLIFSIAACGGTDGKTTPAPSAIPTGSTVPAGPTGTYTASAQGYGGEVVVTLTMDNGKLTDVQAVGADETPDLGGKALEQMQGAMMAANSVAVDGISGATGTSGAILTAARAAYDEAMGVATTAGYTAGTYTASATGHNSYFDVKVTFSTDAITDIVVGENEESLSIGDVSMDIVKNEILARQSLNIDAVSGATISSIALRNAVGDAVEQAGGSVTALQEAAPEDDTTPADVTVEVVVVGGGAAGLAATVEAAQQGKNVLLLEQLGILGGSSARAGFLLGADTKVQKEQEINFPVDQYIAVMKLGDENNAAGEAYAKGSGANIDWLYDLGIQFGPINMNLQHYGTEGARLGGFLAGGLHDVLDREKIAYRLNTRAESLLTDDSGAVVGVKAKAPNGAHYNIHADTVILATGGFFANPEMTAQYFPDAAGNPYDCSMGADGSGMLMAEAAGAALSKMESANFHAIAGDYLGASRSLTLVAGNGGIAVNSRGERFFNEAGDYTKFAAAANQQDAVYAILDQALVDLPVIQNDQGCAAVFDMYTKADTLEDLAKQMGIDPAGLTATIEAYRASIVAGSDEFEKKAANMRTDFTTPPYYAVKTHVENHTNFGGITTDDFTRALTADGTPVPGLYAAGECTALKPWGGAFFSVSVYQGRVAVTTAIADAK